MSEVAAAYNAWSASYDSDDNRTRDLDAEVLNHWLMGRRFGAIVEAGCGTGKNTACLAGVGNEVRALDFSPGMLARARAKVASPNVVFAEADLSTRWPVADASADLVTFNLVLEHIAILDAAFSEVARVLRPGGTLRVSELHPFRQYRGTVARFEGADGSVTRIPAFVHHVSDYLRAAAPQGFTFCRLEEEWHDADAGEPPRLLVLEFARR
jgi:malonyl-CoA O-methyltransferase